MRTATALLTALALMTGGCQMRQDNAANAVAGGDNVADLTPEGPGLTTQLFGGGKPTPLTVQQPLANGAIVYLTSIQAKPTETVVGVRIVSGAERDFELNWNTQKTYLVAGGRKFFLSPPLENQDLKITTGSTMQGELVFLGTLPQQGQVTLVFNEGMSDSQYSSTPGIAIPVPVTAAAWSDDGSKKLSSLSFGGDVARSRLAAATSASGSSLSAGDGGRSTLSPVDTLKSELGATTTDRGTMLSLPGDVLFDFDKATIRADARPTLDKLAALIKAQNPPRTAIEGHSDGKGNDAYNQRLSEARATAVRDYLIGVQTVDGTKLSVKGIGELRPVAPNMKPDGSDDEAGRGKNRRVEVVLESAT